MKPRPLTRFRRALPIRRWRSVRFSPAILAMPLRQAESPGLRTHAAFAGRACAQELRRLALTPADCYAPRIDRALSAATTP